MPRLDSSDVVLLGTGFAGFGAGHRLDEAGLAYVVYDANAYVGGHTATYAVEPGFLFDDGPHVSFTKDERVQRILADAVEGRYEAVPIALDNYWQGHRITHPVQVNLHGLPTDLVVRVLTDFVAASTGAERVVANYEDWCRAAYGDTFAETFPLTYGRKYHTTEAANLTTDWLGPRMYRPNLEEALRGALDPKPVTDIHYVTHFRYPTDGGYVAYIRPWAERSDVRLGHRLVGLDAGKRELRFANGATASYRHLISSLPLPEIVATIEGAPETVRAAASRLAFSSVVMVNLGVQRPDLGDGDHILYVYDADLPFSRISFPHRLSPNVVPPGTGSLQVEWYFSDKYKPLSAEPASFIEPTIDGLRRMGVLREDDVIVAKDARVARYGNVIYDHDRGPAVKTILDYLADLEIRSCGRYGEWNHLWTDEAFLSGEGAASSVLDEVGAVRV
jgi:protoporphyrinogen oxidase